MPGGAPDAGAGDIIFNGPPNNVMQYCDGTNWVAMSGGGGGVPELPSAQIFVGNAASVATPRAVSGDATLSNTGAITITNNAITAAKIAGNAVTSAKIADGTIVAADMADNAVTTAKIAGNAVTSAKIADGTIVAADIADNAVTAAKIAGNAVTSAKIADGAIVAADIANTTITMNKLNATGTADATTFLRGDGQWATPAGGGGGQSCAGGINPQIHNDRCYTQFGVSSWEGVTWTNAQAVCAAWGGPGATMAIINNSTEQSFITAQYAAAQPWIGLTDSGAHGSSEGNPRWVDGTTPSYTNWNAAPNQHNNRDWVRLNTNGTWRYEVNSARPIICEAPNPYSAEGASMMCSNGLVHGQNGPAPVPGCGSIAYGYICISGFLAINSVAYGGECPSG